MMSKNLTRPFALLIFEGALVYLCGVTAIYIRFGVEAPDALGAERGWLKTLLAAADARLLELHTDATLLVIRQGRTSASQMAKAVALLNEERLLGAVLNRVAH